MNLDTISRCFFVDFGGRLLAYRAAGFGSPQAVASRYSLANLWHLGSTITQNRSCNNGGRASFVFRSKQAR